MLIEIDGVWGDYRIAPEAVRDIHRAQQRGREARVAVAMRLPGYGGLLARLAAHYGLAAVPELRGEA